MKAVFAFVILASLVASSTAAIPSLAKDVIYNSNSVEVVYQGAWNQQGDQFCCPETNCQVQVQESEGLSYQDATNQRLRFDGVGSQPIVTLFGSIQKEMLVDPTTLKCLSYCPNTDDFGTYQVPSNSTDLGKVTRNGKVVEQFQYKETLFGIVVMETDNFYLDLSGKVPTPVAEVDLLTPFGESIGKATTTFSSWVPGPLDAKLFAVTGIDTCPEDQNCGNNVRQSYRRRHKLFKTYAKYVQENKMKKIEAAEPFTYGL